MFCLIYEKTYLVGQGPLSYFGNNAQTSAERPVEISSFFEGFGAAELIFHPSVCVIIPMWVRVYCTSLSIFFSYLFIIWCVMSVWVPV